MSTSVFTPLQSADYAFLIGLIESPITLTDDEKLRRLAEEAAHDDTGIAREALDRQLLKEIRYLGSSEIGYWTRSLTGQEPGTSFNSIIQDVAKALKVKIAFLGTEREQMEALVEAYVTKAFADLSPAEQQKMLESLGIERKAAADFLKRSAGVFALPLLLQAFSAIVVEGLIKRVIFGSIAKIIGSQLAARLFTFVAGRFPWWLGWIGPAAWTVSIGWTVFDLQGPNKRKTIPIVLYLGRCSLRDRYGVSPASSEPDPSASSEASAPSSDEADEASASDA